MERLTAPDSTSVGLTRLGRDAQASVDELGPLASLVGTWMGTRGYELIAVPTESSGKEGFRLIVRPYVEIITFSPLGAPIPDRGGPAGDMLLTGLFYDIRITDLETNEPLHFENGMWLYLGEGAAHPIARLASIPHGDVLLAMGTATTADGPPDIPSISGVPHPIEGAPLGYADAYQVPVGAFHPWSPNDVLREAISAKKIVQTVTLGGSTHIGGGLVNIPFVAKNANATAFSCTYWVETVVDTTTGDRVQQLQYSQQTDIDFIPQFKNPHELITWPHVNVNTLLKQ